MFQHSTLIRAGTASADKQDLPQVVIGDSRYVVRYSTTPAEIDEVFKLRFNVFNLEMGEGLVSSFESGRDEDRYDLVCRHLVVVERTTDRIVGTYRLQTNAMAAKGFGFYSATEFDLSTLPHHVLNDAIELGRACIARDHRNKRVLFLLWRGIAAYVAHNRTRFLFGCCSLTSRDHVEGARVASWLERDGHRHSGVVVEPRPGYECIPSWVDSSNSDPKIPNLFGIYLRYGAKVCSPPAVDRAFGTIDYLAMFDVDTMAKDFHQLLFGA